MEIVSRTGSIPEEASAESVNYDYRPFFISVVDDVNSLHDEFTQYLLEASPTNGAVEVIEYRHDSTARYPRLANVVPTLLCLANGSCENVFPAKFSGETNWRLSRDVNFHVKSSGEQLIWLHLIRLYEIRNN